MLLVFQRLLGACQCKNDDKRVNSGAHIPQVSGGKKLLPPSFPFPSSKTQ